MLKKSPVIILGNPFTPWCPVHNPQTKATWDGWTVLRSHRIQMRVPGLGQAALLHTHCVSLPLCHHHSPSVPSPSLVLCAITIPSTAFIYSLFQQTSLSAHCVSDGARDYWWIGQTVPVPMDHVVQNPWDCQVALQSFGVHTFLPILLSKH